jgi:aminoglycoside phosphotransferase (APT) family kinase protein
LVVPPPAEVPIDVALVRALLEEQHPDLLAFPIVEASEGWDNRTFRLGEDPAVRLPRRAASAPLIEQRGRAWALALGIAYLAHADANDDLGAIAARTINEAVLA